MVIEYLIRIQVTITNQLVISFEHIATDLRPFCFVSKSFYDVFPFLHVIFWRISEQHLSLRLHLLCYEVLDALWYIQGLVFRVQRPQMALLAGLVMAGLPDRAALTLATEASASIAAFFTAPNIALNRRIRCLTSATYPRPREYECLNQAREQKDVYASSHVLAIG